MQSIFDRFWPIFADFGHRGEKNSLKNHLIIETIVFVTSALKTSFWASLKKFHFLAISWFSRYLGEAALRAIWLQRAVK